ncbi:MAG TPA: acetyl-CoA carboxylase biotin carboxylase subunit [Terriglobia bacterium]|jgi:acetyl-CoA carboxylase biotin carboxylase subunit|nr:acetyl-CoA carboxylase biotin carboxylase subunit [Terriglobia bacterium]
MFKKILIANRGEIALRVICTCKELGIETVAVYSEADQHSLHVRFADEAICIGPARSSESYLNIASIISAAEITNAEAIHPGYGFLSESAHFAEVCRTSQITFIGPTPEAMRLMGDKNAARKKMAELGLPVLPGSGVLQSEEEAREAAAGIGYPVMVKAAAGGGGRGMRVVNAAKDLAHAIETAQQEAQAAFGVSDVYLEKYVSAPRHIEFQVLADQHGKVVHLGERECTIQRRHQKLVEESPSTQVDDDLRRETGHLVVEALKQVGYTNAGTVEFLMDENRKLYFLEMNTRIQVEHPVTEMVTGLDLVKKQILIAAGLPLELPGETVHLRGHSIECRITAENPETFAPSAGKITGFNAPGGTGVRLDTAAYAEGVVPPYYDSLIAKLIVHGSNRAEAISRMRRALDMFIIEGISTSIPLHQKIMADPDFRAGNFDTHYLLRFARNGAGARALEL